MEALFPAFSVTTIFFKIMQIWQIQMRMFRVYLWRLFSFLTNRGKISQLVFCFYSTKMIIFETRMLSNAFGLNGSYFGTVLFDLLTHTSHQKNLKMKISLSTDTLLVWINLTCTHLTNFPNFIGKDQMEYLIAEKPIAIGVKSYRN